MDNHFIPEFYFRPWLDGRGHLIQYSRKPTGAIASTRKTPGQICYRPDLHTLVGKVDSEKLHIVEQWLSASIDDKAAPAVRKLLDEGLKAIGDQGAHAIVGLILSLIVRRPENVAYLKERAPEEWKAAMAREELALRNELAGTADAPSLPSLLEYAETRHPGAVENSGNLLITGIVSDLRYWKRLIDLTWWVADFSGTAVNNQLTSDRAVTFTGSGLDDPNVSLILPISPIKVLYLTTEHMRIQCAQQGLGQLGLATLKLTIGNARNFVYGTAAANTNLVAKYLAKFEARPS